MGDFVCCYTYFLDISGLAGAVSIVQCSGECSVGCGGNNGDSTEDKGSSRGIAVHWQNSKAHLNFPSNTRLQKPRSA